MLSDSTSWFSRNQLVRNLEAAGELAASRACGVLLFGEQELAELGDELYEQSLPHLGKAERLEVRRRYLGQTTWHALCEALDIPVTSLPDERQGYASSRIP